jgi:trehalose-phosphatase
MITEAKLKELSRAPILLVACDYDGTIAPIVDEPAQAAPHREALVALRMLADLPQTHVAVISGRALRDLAGQIGENNLYLVGSHGSEFDEALHSQLPPHAREQLARLTEQLRQIASSSPGFIVEEKPAALAFHFRKASEKDAERAVFEILAGPAKEPGVFVRPGKKVLELSLVETNKGHALQRLRHRIGASAVLFMGDDLTDEDAFETLAGPDAGVKVGPGDTRAASRVADCGQATEILTRLATERSTWLAGSDAPAIDQLSLLSDQRSLALVAPNGRVVWFCAPRLDAPPLFSELIGGPSAGYFEIRQSGVKRPWTQQYDGCSFTLCTEWEGLRVTDYLDCSDGRAYQRAGRSDLIRVIEGSGHATITFAPRLDFGRLATRIIIHETGLEVEGGRDPIVLRAPGIRWNLIEEGGHQIAVGTVELSNESVALELRYGTANLSEEPRPEPVRRVRTHSHWDAWANKLSIPAVQPELVRRSALVLRALTYGPTGAISAAATTSLPECIGGIRNWDYRYCWPRDAALAGAALARLGNNGIAMKFLDWLLGVLDQCETPDRLSPVYTVTGGNLATEADIMSLSGYSGSRPVRVGNAAAQQVQLDVFGAVALLVATLAEQGCPLSGDHRRLVEMMVAAVEARWKQPDHGIWEPRLPPRHNVHSKVMCWMTVDRAIAVTKYLGRPSTAWTDLRTAIAEDVLTNAWRQEVNAFSSHYQDTEVDAALLWLALSGFLADDDHRLISTVEWIDKRLRSGPTVYRYRYDDGLPGVEGGFHICTAWLIEALIRCGRRSQAEELFGQLASLAGPTGLLSEEYDPRTRRALGNYPQAYSHTGLINAAVALAGGQGG